MFTTVGSSMIMSCAMPITTSTHQRTACEPRRPESVFTEAGAPRSMVVLIVLLACWAWLRTVWKLIGSGRHGPHRVGRVHQDEGHEVAHVLGMEGSSGPTCCCGETMDKVE